MPVSTAAGRRVRVTFSPLCRPTPVALIAVLSVRCFNMLLQITLLFTREYSLFNQADNTILAYCAQPSRPCRAGIIRLSKKPDVTINPLVYAKMPGCHILQHQTFSWLLPAHDDCWKQTPQALRLPQCCRRHTSAGWSYRHARPGPT